MSPSPSQSPKSQNPSSQNLGRAFLAAGLAWLVPGAGHFLLKRFGRGFIFFSIIVGGLLIGAGYQGRLPWVWAGSPLQIMATLGAMGSGSAFLVMKYLSYEGDLRAAGFEYGSAFILTAGLMNYLLVLDAWDIALGRKPGEPDQIKPDSIKPDPSKTASQQEVRS